MRSGSTARKRIRQKAAMGRRERDVQTHTAAGRPEKAALAQREVDTLRGLVGTFR